MKFYGHLLQPVSEYSMQLGTVFMQVPNNVSEYPFTQDMQALPENLSQLVKGMHDLLYDIYPFLQYLQVA